MPLPLANPTLFAYFDHIGYVLYRAISSANTMFTKMVVMWYLISDHWQNVNGVGTIKKSLIRTEVVLTDPQKRKKKAVVLPACDVWLWHPCTARRGLLASERVRFVVGAGWVCTSICLCNWTVRTVWRHSLVRAGLLGFDPTRQLTPADASKVECRLPAEDDESQEQRGSRNLPRTDSSVPWGFWDLPKKDNK